MVRQIKSSVTEEKAAALVRIHGRVQGVGFRFFAQNEAELLGLGGWVRNCPDGSVESYAEGPKLKIEKWAQRLQQGPSLSSVDHLEIVWRIPQNGSSSFTLRS